MFFADECFWAGDKVSEGILEGMITEPTIRVEPKGKDAFAVQNHMCIIIASNDEWVVPAAGLELFSSRYMSQWTRSGSFGFTASRRERY